jgi:hypothetical protein
MSCTREDFCRLNLGNSLLNGFSPSLFSVPNRFRGSSTAAVKAAANGSEGKWQQQWKPALAGGAAIRPMEPE